MSKLNGRKCRVCALPLRGRQRDFCSRECKNREFYRKQAGSSGAFCAFCGLWNVQSFTYASQPYCSTCFVHATARREGGRQSLVALERRVYLYNVVAVEKYLDAVEERRDELGGPQGYPPDSLLLLTMWTAQRSNSDFERWAEGHDAFVFREQGDVTVNGLKTSRDKVEGPKTSRNLLT